MAIHNIFITAVVSIFLVQCSGKQFFKDNERSAPDSSETIPSQSLDRDQQADNADDGQKQAANEPVMTGGAFLNCQTTSESTEADDRQYGCRLEDDGEKVKAGERYTFEAQLLNTLGEILSISVNVMPTDNQWHWTFTVPLELLAEAQLNVKVTDLETNTSTQYETPLDPPATNAELTDESVRLRAEKTYNPSRWSDGNATFDGAVSVTLPESIPVIDGNAGNHLTTLTLSPDINCLYRGGADVSSPLASQNQTQIDKGQFYHFESCSNGATPGTNLDTSQITLHVDNGDKSSRTRIELELPITGGGDG
jgi:hypothetical protein